MDLWKDILLDSDGDLAVFDGDLVVGYSFNQEAAIIAQSVPGNWKNDPVIGADVASWINDESSIEEVLSQLKRHFTRDGKQLDAVDDGSPNLTLRFK